MGGSWRSCASYSGAEGYRFEPYRAYHPISILQSGPVGRVVPGTAVVPFEGFPLHSHFFTRGPQARVGTSADRTVSDDGRISGTLIQRACAGEPRRRRRLMTGYAFRLSLVLRATVGVSVWSACRELDDR